MRIWNMAMATVAVGGLTAASAGAQTALPASVLLDTVTVEASGGSAGGGVGGTVTTSTTTREVIENRLIEGLDDVARVEAGVTFDRANRSINIRGLAGPRVLTTVDGIRVPYLFDVTRGAVGGPDAFDFNTLSSFDLTRGADPLLGSGALGGVLALDTLDPDDLLPGERRLGGVTKTGYDSIDDSWFNATAAAARFGQTSVLLQGGYRGGNEIETQGLLDTFGSTRTAPNPLDYDQYNGLAKIHHHVEGGHRFGIAGEIFHREDEIDARTSQSLSDPAVRGSGNYRPGDYTTRSEVERRRVSLSYDYEAPDFGAGWADGASAVLYWQNVERLDGVDAVRSVSVVGPFTRQNAIEEETVGLNAHAVRGFETGLFSHILTVGTEMRISTSDQYASGADACALGRRQDVFSCRFLKTNQADTPKIEGRAVGLFAENEIGMLNGRMRVTPGLRFDWYEERPELTDAYRRNEDFDGTLPPSSSGTEVSPKLTIAYDLLPGLTTHVSYLEGFRAPTVGELYSRFGGVGTYLRAGNPNLEAETSRGLEAGLELRRETYGAYVNLFRTDYDDFIDVVQIAPPGGEYPIAGVSSYINIPEARISGVEAGGHISFGDGWRARGSLAYMEGENITDGTYLDSVAPLTGLLGLGYERRDWGGEISARLAGARDKVDEGFEAPGYGVLDVTAWYAPERIPGLKVGGGVFNILDKTYYDALNVPDVRSQPDIFYSEAGRSFKLNVAYSF
ncbi:TonB-dependent hemoglobin/transferrin/lactoferrin family receptor [Fulvimarina sp. 2208YS6-2-32]|uniref:TonB-dependent hemoglobin/transferrin/lactoferrin family receptor n=1 Tax=Fulvimarina uroteuthidis TaxID=3098149 RepID=A0ABU5I461_9HYPH|nr:TonB-dependent hemoglobin/transferrin/lactoferrin family receptor [Fulvimarina sp. 2208YS6-2-32]MDY8110177.1 TonB-dependent hemoglobin/transferrin/lactoferrin family receptor [Fulvimarina sp. 2208YS6-2-32]